MQLMVVNHWLHLIYTPNIYRYILYFLLFSPIFNKQIKKKHYFVLQSSNFLLPL